MASNAAKILSLAVLLLVLALPAFAQNTKGDRPQSERETRFKKPGKSKIAKSKRKNKGSKFNARTSRASVGRNKRVQPRRGTERARNSYSQNNSYATGRSKPPKGDRIRSKSNRTGVIRNASPGRSDDRSYGGNGYVTNRSRSPKESKRKFKPATSTGGFRNTSPGRSDDRSYGGGGYVTNRSRSPKESKRRFKPTTSTGGFRAASPGRSDDRSYDGGHRYVTNTSPSQRKKQRVITRPATANARIRNTSPARKDDRAYPQPYRTVRRPPTSAERNRTYNTQSWRRIKRPPPNRKDDKPTRVPKRFLHNARRTANETSTSASNESQLRGAQAGAPTRSARKNAVRPRSASRAHVGRKTINVLARFPRPKKRSETATTRDIAGRRLRTKNYQSPTQSIHPGGTFRHSSSGKYRLTPSQRERYARYKNFSSKPQTERHIGAGRNAKVNFLQAPRRSEKMSGPGAFSSLQSRLPGPGKKSRIRPRSASRSFLARKSINVWAHFPRPKRKSERAVTTDIAGKRLRTKNFQSTPGIISPNISPYSKRTRSGDRPYQGAVSGRQRSATKFGQRPWLGDIAKRSVRGIKVPRKDSPSRVNLGGYRSATEAGERRTGKRPVPVKQPGMWAEVLRFRSNKVSGQTAIKGGGSVSGRLWNNNGNSLRTRQPGKESVGIGNFKGNLRSQRPLKGGGSVSGRLWNNNRKALSARSPGKGTRNAGEFQGNLRANRPVKGGGSVSGRLWNNQGKALDARMPGYGTLRAGGFSGNIRTQKPPKGGGSISGRLWNNQGRALDQRVPGDGTIRAGGFSGNIRTQKPPKGGGSVSGRLWNNQGRALDQRMPGDGTIRAGGFSGNMRTQRPVKGGGSISGRLWNNKNAPISIRVPSRTARKMSGFPGKIRMFSTPGLSNQGEEYSGDLKANKPLKGGGSVSGKLWNNKNSPISTRVPSNNARKMSGYPGKIRMFSTPGFSNQGEEFTGDLKATKPVKGGGSVSGKLWNNRNTPILTRVPPNSARKVSGFPGRMRTFSTPGFSNQGEEYSGDLKMRKPAKGKGEAIPVRKPTSAAARAGDYSGTLKLSILQKPYVKNQNASQLALKKQRPSASTYKGDDLQIKTRQFDYIRNKNASPAALKVREPGRSFGKAAHFQGNVRMQKFRLFENTELHPDAKFVKAHKNNVQGEKDAATNLKLWWARLFRKNETQPDHLKEKDRKPRYDKGEQGLWYD